eukprot:9057795-Alexandrium_andersonii.AAC.1
MSSGFAQGHRGRSELHAGGCGTSVQGCPSPWVALDFMGYVFAGPRFRMGSTDFNKEAADGSGQSSALGPLG